MNILKRISDKLMDCLDSLTDKYGIFGIAAFLVGSAAALIVVGASMIYLICIAIGVATNG